MSFFNSPVTFCRQPEVAELEKNLVKIVDAHKSGAVGTTKPLPKAEDIKLVLSDVDGTLLDDAHDVNPRTSDAIRFRESLTAPKNPVFVFLSVRSVQVADLHLLVRQNYPHIPFVPVTGKQRVSCEYVARVCGLEDMPSGCCHGSIIYTPEGKIETQTGIGPEVVSAVTDFLKAINKSVFIYEHDSVNCVYLEDHPSLDFYAITRGYDPSIRDMRGTNYMDRVRSGEVVVTKMCKFSPSFLAFLCCSLPRSGGLSLSSLLLFQSFQWRSLLFQSTWRR